MRRAAAGGGGGDSYFSIRFFNPSHIFFLLPWTALISLRPKALLLHLKRFVLTQQRPVLPLSSSKKGEGGQNLRDDEKVEKGTGPGPTTKTIDAPDVRSVIKPSYGELTFRKNKVRCYFRIAQTFRPSVLFLQYSPLSPLPLFVTDCDAVKFVYSFTFSYYARHVLFCTRAYPLTASVPWRGCLILLLTAYEELCATLVVVPPRDTTWLMQCGAQITAWFAPMATVMPLQIL